MISLIGNNDHVGRAALGISRDRRVLGYTPWGRPVVDGRIEIDSNVVERTIRPVALKRKNALFAGSNGGAEHWAVIASLIETCKLIGVEPHNYLADVISRIVNGHLNSKIDELPPWAYPAAPALKAVA